MIKVFGRVAQIPEYDRVIGCTDDHMVEERLFYVYDLSLAGFDFKLAVKNPDGSQNVIDLDKSMDGDAVVLKWTIERAHLKKNGIMLAQLCAIKGEGDDIKKWHTLDMMEFTIKLSLPEGEEFRAVYPSEFEQIEAKLTLYKTETSALADEAKDAKDDAVIAKNEAESAAQAAMDAAVKTPYIGENKNWFVWDKEGGAFADSGQSAYALPQIGIGEVETIPPSENAEVIKRADSPPDAPVFDFKLPRGASGVYVGSGAMPEGCNVQIDPDGEAVFMEIEAGTVYDTVITDQEQFDSMVATPGFMNAKNILLACNINLSSPPEVPQGVHSISAMGNTVNIMLEGDGWQTINFGGCTLKDIRFAVWQGLLELTGISNMEKCEFLTPITDESGAVERKIKISSAEGINKITYTPGGQPGDGMLLQGCKNVHDVTIKLQSADGFGGFEQCENLSGCRIDGADTAFSNCKCLVNCIATPKKGGTGYYKCAFLSNCAAINSYGAGEITPFTENAAMCTDTCIETE